MLTAALLSEAIGGDSTPSQPHEPGTPETGSHDDDGDGPRERLRFRTVFISDIHLGTRGCRAEFLLDFLKSVECEHLFLVGDIIDLWKAKSGWYWSEEQNKVLRRFLKMANRGTKVYFLPGNHDEYFRDFLGIQFGDIRICGEMEHTLADGRRFLVLHGDRFDGIVCNHKWLAKLGGKLYEWSISLNTWFNWARKKLGMRYWSLSQYLKLKAKKATQVIGTFENVLADYARSHGFDGVVCGHIHHAEMRDIHGVLYCNDGDWVESCTALVEHADGRLEILTWTDDPSANIKPLITAKRMAKLRKKAAARLAAAAERSARTVVPAS